MSDFIILFVRGSFNPPTLMHLRMFGKLIQSIAIAFALFL